MFEELRKVNKNMQQITAAKVLTILIGRPEFKDLIIRLNTEEQLFKKGIDAQGKSLGVYADFTIIKKKEDGLPSGHVTLFQEGPFYKTWTVKVVGEDIIIEADGDKGDKNLMDVYGEDIVGLFTDSLDILINEIEIVLPELVEDLLLAGTS